MTAPSTTRRRLILLLLAAGLAPLAAWGLLTSAIVQQGLTLSPPLGPLLDRTEAAVGDPQVVSELRQARLHLAQAELARRALSRRVPVTLAAAVAASSLLVVAVAWLLSRQLVRQFDRMGRQLEAQRDRLRVTEQLAAWQGVARALAHELGNPLTAMKMALGRLRRPERPVEATEEAVALLEEEMDVLLRMTRSFSEFAQLPAPTPGAVDLAALADEVCAVYRPQAPVEVIVRAEARPTVQADADQLRRALGNLLKNALEASRAGDGPVEVEVTVAGGEARLTVADGGVGIGAPLEGEALTRSLGSTKADGSGLGLPIAHKIVHDHGGRLRLEPRAPRGTRALVSLPYGEAP